MPTPLAQEALAQFEKQALAENLGEKVGGVIAACDFDGFDDAVFLLFSHVIKSAQNVFSFGSRGDIVACQGDRGIIVAVDGCRVALGEANFMENTAQPNDFFAYAVEGCKLCFGDRKCDERLIGCNPANGTSDELCDSSVATAACVGA